MAFMRRDVNLGLLVLIIASIIIFSGFTVYYQTTFRDVSMEYQEKLDQLKQVTDELSSKRSELNETYSLKVKAEQDRRALDSSYKDVSDENEGLKNDKANLQSEISSTKSQLGVKTAELDATENLLASVQAEMNKYKSQWQSCESDLDNVCEYIDEDLGAALPGDC